MSFEEYVHESLEEHFSQYLELEPEIEEEVEDGPNTTTETD